VRYETSVGRASLNNYRNRIVDIIQEWSDEAIDLFVRKHSRAAFGTTPDIASLIPSHRTVLFAQDEVASHRKT
jgi:hypothetical protein